MRIALLSNPSSGRGRHAAADDVARRILTDAGHEVLHVRGSSYEQARDAGRALLGDGPHRNVEALVVVGGDGMVHLGVDIVATTGVPLGIVATGTGNDIARHFGLPSRDAEASARLINQALSGKGAITAVDAIYASRPDGTLLAPQRRWSLAVVSAGVDAAVNARANTLSWPAGEGRYVRAFTAELATLSPYGYRVTTDEGAWEGPALLLAVANTRYVGGGMDLAPQADPTDGLLEVVRLDPCGRLSVLALLRRVFAGTHVGRPGVHVERSRSLTIEPWPDDGAGGWLRDPPHPYADGERLAGLPLHLEAVPQAVGLLLPA